MTEWDGSGCIFCRIAAGTEPATIRYQDEEVLVFLNRLHAAPVMLLVVPRLHLTQLQLWQGGLIAKVSRIATEMGASYCPGGFRILSNFGEDSLQTQDHGHLHVIGGARLGHYL